MPTMSEDIVSRLRIDPGQRTVGQLLQDREAALYEIVQLRKELESLKNKFSGSQSMAGLERSVNETAYRAGTMLRLAEVCKLLGVSKSTIYNKISEGCFPAPVQLGDRMVRWPIDVIEKWKEARIEQSHFRS